MNNKISTFRELHNQREPLVLANAWDLESARLVEASGAKAIATSSWAIADHLGFADGEKVPLDTVLALFARLVQQTNLPVTADFETGYAMNNEMLLKNVALLVETGVVGMNFEDQNLVNGGLVEASAQADKIGLIAEKYRERLFINARTDVFLQTDPKDHATRFDDACARADLYAKAGADCIFVPGLAHPELIRELVEKVELPVNIMVADEDVEKFMGLGVARISTGPNTYLAQKTDKDCKRQPYVGAYEIGFTG